MNQMLTPPTPADWQAFVLAADELAASLSEEYDDDAHQLRQSA